MFSDYRNYILNIRNNLIQCGVSVKVNNELSYEEVYKLAKELQSLLWYFSVLGISGSNYALTDFILPLDRYWKRYMKDKYNREFQEYLPTYKLISVDFSIKSKVISEGACNDLSNMLQYYQVEYKSTDSNNFLGMVMNAQMNANKDKRSDVVNYVEHGLILSQYKGTYIYVDHGVILSECLKEDDIRYVSTGVVLSRGSNINYAEHGVLLSSYNNIQYVDHGVILSKEVNIQYVSTGVVLSRKVILEDSNITYVEHGVLLSEYSENSNIQWVEHGVLLRRVSSESGEKSVFDIEDAFEDYEEPDEEVRTPVRFNSVVKEQKATKVVKEGNPNRDASDTLQDVVNSLLTRGKKTLVKGKKWLES